jgi:hypothetical protein
VSESYIKEVDELSISVTYLLEGQELPSKKKAAVVFTIVVMLGVTMLSLFMLTIHAIVSEST